MKYCKVGKTKNLKNFCSGTLCSFVRERNTQQAHSTV